MIERDPFTGELKLDKTEKLTFGKYLGRSLATVMVLDPQYLIWVVQSNNKWRISDTWRQYLEDYAEEESRFKAKKHRAQAQAERLKEYLFSSLAGEKYKSPRVSISYRTTPRVIVDDVLDLPPQFVKFAAPEPKKSDIMAAIKNGEEVRGAHVESNTSIIIK